MQRLVRGGWVIAISLTVLLAPATVHATSPAVQSPDKAIVISPFLTETQVQPADATKDISVSLTNNTSERQNFVISALDFGSLNDSGGILFAGENSSKLAHKYGLAKWLTLPEDHLTLAAGQSTKIQAVIRNEASLGPGGHYAAIIMSVDKQDEERQSTVNVEQKISALIFATKVGGEVYDLRLDQIQHDGNWRQLPKIITLGFHNSGNVHVVPRGSVRLVSPSGHVVSRGIINDASAYVLPETSRQYVVQTYSVGSRGWEPGTYRVEADYRYDGYARFASKSISFRYYNLLGLTFLLVLVFLAVFLAAKRWPGRLRFYHRHVSK